MNKILQDLFSGKDGITHDIGRWSWVVTTAGIIGAAIWNAIHGSVIGLSELAQAFGINVAAHGGALFAKAKTEPDAETKP